jgi:hypothetical protein
MNFPIDHNASIALGILYMFGINAMLYNRKTPLSYMEIITVLCMGLWIFWMFEYFWNKKKTPSPPIDDNDGGIFINSVS